MTVGPPRRSDRPVTQPSVGLALDIGMRLTLSVIIGLGAGVLVDGWLRTSPAFTLVGMVLGIGAAMYTIWVVAQQSVKR